MVISTLERVFGNRNALVDVLAVFFGIGSWIGINSLWVQLPLLVNVLPEFWNLASYLVIIIQIANIGPLAYTLTQKYCPIADNIIIYALLAIGVISGGLIPFFYDITVYFLSTDRSLVFFIFTFCFALVGCTSSVLFMPYFGRFRGIYLITYLIGEGLSGLVPSILGLIQGVGGNAQCKVIDDDIVPFYPLPRFSTQTFFLIIFSLLVASLLAFILLDRLKSVRDEYANVKILNGNNYQYDDTSMTSDPAPKEIESVDLSTINYRCLLVYIGILCMFVNAIVPSIMPFSTLPYGNVTYHLAITLSLMANPIACFIAMFVKKNSVNHIFIISIIFVPFLSYAITTAVLSPAPPLTENTFGEFLVITSWTLVIGLASYIRLKITTMFRLRGGKSLVWIGIWTQIGSFVGSIISFTLTNYTGIFVSFQPC
ncbi:solute carrier family 52, riboflavin transporter, member 3-A-like [Chironomus tepperi]|uniref:solute carrier family 52, riboflavin transporter, member 3-A-like n=1 Tax=Chironomus tepperi TaxID=113505 RepID=UPI00391FB6D8